MTIKKFQGKTEEDAVQKAKLELGEAVVIMNVKEVKPKGLLRMFKKSSYELTAAIEEEGDKTVQPKGTEESAFGGVFRAAADEKIVMPALERTSIDERLAHSIYEPKVDVSSGLEKKIENLQTLLEKNLIPENEKEKEMEKEDLPEEERENEELRFIKMLYGVLLENEVDERYVNQIMDEIEKLMNSGTSVDYLLSNIYQKMILKLGQTKTIELIEKKPKVVFFIGPTGVGKTTTIAKIASKFKIDYGKKVALMTADTYRIAAVEQLRTYANILDTPITIVYSAEELNEAVKEVSGYDLVLVDTAGFSHKNQEQREDVKELIDNLDAAFEKEVYLVLSATTKYKDLLEIADIYKENFSFRMIFTKLDETACYGNIFNMKMYTGAELSYSTYGQSVPDDIEVFDTQKMVKTLLGGK